MDIKNLLYKMFAGASVLLLASCMGVDNFDEPGERFTGTIIDSETGKPILADQGECHVRIWQMSWSDNPGQQDIPVKQDGTFNNNKLFAGTYDVQPEGAWWPVERESGVSIKGTAKKDFTVTPYLELFDFKTSLNGTKLTMSCRFYAPKDPGAEQLVEDIRPFLSTRIFCGINNRIDVYDKNGGGTPININKPWAEVEKEADGKSKAYTFIVDVKPGYTYYVRMGARVKSKYENYNYTDIVEVQVPNK